MTILRHLYTYYTSIGDTMFKEYQSKPITRLAYEIQPTDAVEYTSAANEAVLVRTGLVFGAYVQPVAGDYICHLTDDDVYHVAKDVFEERNFV